MPIPLIPIAAAAVGVAGGTLLSSLFGAGTKKEEIVQRTEPVISPISHTYAPQISKVYSPTTTTTSTYAPQVSYAPIVQIHSPGAQATSKKELMSDIDASAESRPAVSQTPISSIPYQFAAPTTTGATKLDMGEGMIQLVLLGALAVGAIYLLK